jgi:hypothetical protein
MINRNGDILLLNMNDLIKMIRDNTDKRSEKIDEDLIGMIVIYYGRFSVKQSNWILEKVKYIVIHNNIYGKNKYIKDIRFLV